MKTCRRCGKELLENGYRCYGKFEEGKKVWCEEHWKELQEFLKRKWAEERIPELEFEAKILLKECERNKKRFINLLTQTKRFLTSLQKSKEVGNISVIKNYTQQYEITEFIEKR